MKLIYNGVTIPEPIPRDEARRTLGLDADTLVGVVVANLIHYKGHRDLFEGLARIQSRIPGPWRILLAGRDHDLWQELQNFAGKHRFAENVRFLGPRSDIPLLLAAADFGLLASREEGFSNVVLEGMAAGLPMIVTAVGGNPEAVIDGETGLVVPPSDPKAIGSAILRLAADPALRKCFGAAGRSRAKSEFSLDRCVNLPRRTLRRVARQDRLASTDPSSETWTPAAPAQLRTLKKRPLMLAYWGRYGALPQLTLELAGASQRLGQIEGTTISISTTNELFEKYSSLWAGNFSNSNLPIIFGRLRSGGVSQSAERTRQAPQRGWYAGICVSDVARLVTSDETGACQIGSSSYRDRARRRSASRRPDGMGQSLAVARSPSC